MGLWQLFSDTHFLWLCTKLILESFGIAIAIVLPATLVLFVYLRNVQRNIFLNGRFCEIKDCGHYNSPLNKKGCKTVEGGKNVYSYVITTPAGISFRVCDSCKNAIEYWKTH